METTTNKMSPYATQFFNKLSKYLDTQLYYYGSIQRADYFPEYSDIDVDIFTDTESGTISKLQHFLGVPKRDFRKFVYKLHKTGEMVYGHKVKYADITNKFAIEISIYNEKYKDNVLYEHNSKLVLPFYVTILLIILKTFYYRLGILPEPVYDYLKNIIMNYLVEGTDVEFVVIDIKKE